MTTKKSRPHDALDALIDEARAGRSEAWLAEQAGLSVRQVQLWKRKRGLSSDRGPVQETISALRGLTSAYDPRRHRTAEHIDFTTPEYVLRQPLSYTQYARACFTLHVVAQFSPLEIAEATGTKETDVETALALWRRHLKRKGRPCLGCAVLLDPTYGEFCSRSCHDRVR